LLQKGIISEIATSEFALQWAINDR